MALAREGGTDGANVFYFVRKGRSFSTTSGPRVGFSSGGDVSLYMRGTQGSIVSPGTRVRFTYPGITRIRIDGSLASNRGRGTDWVEVDVPSGTHQVELVTADRPALRSCGWRTRETACVPYDPLPSRIGISPTVW